MRESIEANIKTWSDPAQWVDGGERWSQDWGGTINLYNDFIWPRINQYLPVSVGVEIAPGYGRITDYLLVDIDYYYGYDLNENCVEFCKEKYKNWRAVFAVNDGFTIPYDGEDVEFVFSWDSLVHCSQDIVTSYISEIWEILAHGGVAFLHHSTWATSGAPQNPHWRDESCSHIEIAKHAKALGFRVDQELIVWGYEDYLTDCLTTLRKPSQKIGS